MHRAAVNVTKDITVGRTERSIAERTIAAWGLKFTQRGTLFRCTFTVYGPANLLPRVEEDVRQAIEAQKSFEQTW